MIPTVAPASAAARAARWPARPAPMIRTSWLGISGADPIRPRGTDAVREPDHRLRRQALGTRRLRCDRGLQRAPDLLDRDDPAQDPARIHGHQRAVAAQRLRAEQCLERVVRTDSPIAIVAVHQLADRARPVAGVNGALDPLLVDDADEPVGL